MSLLKAAARSSVVFVMFNAVEYSFPFAGAGSLPSRVYRITTPLVGAANFNKKGASQNPRGALA